jgi:hypothetical protein
MTAAPDSGAALHAAYADRETIPPWFNMAVLQVRECPDGR